MASVFRKRGYLDCSLGQGALIKKERVCEQSIVEGVCA